MQSTCKTLRLTRWHLCVWLGMAALAGGLCLRACLRYNEVAGTDKSPVHIATITVAVMAGPLVGPVANPHAANPFQLPSTVIAATALLSGVQFLALVPFLFVKRPVSNWTFTAAWAGFIAATGAWFVAALISLGFHLS